ncbi:hypothetical protein TNCV_2756321 [Trichonephila clavipes]|nr:hypothetical protein TNCV_2756321 [Trichonephila clavipes]
MESCPHYGLESFLKRFSRPDDLKRDRARFHPSDITNRDPYGVPGVVDALERCLATRLYPTGNTQQMRQMLIEEWALLPKKTVGQFGAEYGETNSVVVDVVSFPERRKEICESLRHVGLLHDRWRHHLSPPPQFRHGLEGQHSASVVSAATTHRTFGPNDLTSRYSMSTWRVSGGNGHQTQAHRSGVRCSDH